MADARTTQARPATAETVVSSPATPADRLTVLAEAAAPDGSKPIAQPVTAAATRLETASRAAATTATPIQIRATCRAGAAER